MACTKAEDTPATTSSASSAIAATTAPAAPPAKPATKPVPKADEPASDQPAPRVWEEAAAAVRGTEPKRPEVEEVAPPIWPACATFEGPEMLREKYRDAYAKLSVETDEQNAAKREAADKEWLPKQQGWLAASNELDKAMLAGQFGAGEGAAQLDKYGPIGAQAKVVRVALDPSPAATAFRKELTKDDRWSKPFECTLLGGARTVMPLDAKMREALRASGSTAATTEVDQLACEVVDGGAPRLAVVVEIPVRDPRAKVGVQGDRGAVSGYEVRTSPGLDPEIA